MGLFPCTNEMGHKIHQIRNNWTACGELPINYPFGIDDGCGSPHYRNLLICNNGKDLQLRTPSGRYRVLNISYTDPHIVVSDPLMWNCENRHLAPRAYAFSLDTSTPFSLSKINNFLFFNCSDAVISQPHPSFCEQSTDRCDPTCDTASYLCQNIPICPSLLGHAPCCSYYPRTSESLRLMLEHCQYYTSIYWRFRDGAPPYDQVPAYGVRIDFEIPATTRCLKCLDVRKGKGTCGFDTQSQSFLCLCDGGNVTTYCKDRGTPGHSRKVAIVAGTVTTVSIGAAVGVTGILIWYLKKVRPNQSVTFGVQNNTNRLF
ncbi:wall-associated receptor kinase-like 20 isoform X2 [Amborella trichopoda]|uniref:wall-associated receptor kinase-like 20 isoform X2 n=1 Tax=Amborella trichopoda TaxID=13333 RepID=UPI0009BF3D6E|nr:wall-associated receptor kinase-like 20 isoform X2 [Amborella trichopoda]|eukprot:XP_020524723.1 wall-associated receptor kinase-like 20 isoform X2 [Amborella trichopoda]